MKRVLSASRGKVLLNPTREESIWTAGFFDGEGCISLTKVTKPNSAGNSTYSLVVLISQRDENLLLWLQRRWGGRINPGRFSLKLSGDNAGRLLEDILPHLRTRRLGQAEAALEYRRHLQPGKNLNKEGVALREHFRAVINAKQWPRKRGLH